jgi:UDP-N-acetylmuramyl pentapeptide synthase
MKLKDLIQDINAVRVVGYTEQEISGVTFDSREVIPGSLSVRQKVPVQ